jgi:hypothetical protein
MNILKIRFELTNPFDRWDFFKPLGCLWGKLTKYTAWELEHNFYSAMIVDVDVDWKVQCDHAGFYLGIGLLGYGVGFRIYDTRHWNSDTNEWEEYNFDEYFEIDR